MLRIPLFSRIVIIGLVVLGLAYAMPNLFYPRVESHNDAVRTIEAAGATPEAEAARDGWPGWLPSTLVNLGLDLRGGASLLAEVQVGDVYADRMDGLWPEIRDSLRDLRDQVGGIRRVEAAPDELRIRLQEPAGMEAALAAVRDIAQPVTSLTGAEP